jgi:hypothetical protein
MIIEEKKGREVRHDLPSRVFASSSSIYHPGSSSS